MAVVHIMTLLPKAGHRDEMEALCHELVQYARDSRDCRGAMYGKASSDEEAVVCQFVFGSMGPHDRFTSLAATNGPYKSFREQIEPLLAEPLHTQVFADMDGFLAVL